MREVASGERTRPVAVQARRSTGIRQPTLAIQSAVSTNQVGLPYSHFIIHSAVGSSQYRIIPCIHTRYLVLVGSYQVPGRSPPHVHGIFMELVTEHGALPRAPVLHAVYAMLMQ